VKTCFISIITIKHLKTTTISAKATIATIIKQLTIQYQDTKPAMTLYTNNATNNSNMPQLVNYQMVSSDTSMPNPFKKLAKYFKSRKSSKRSSVMSDTSFSSSSSSLATSVSSSDSLQKPSPVQAESKPKLVLPRRAFNPQAVEFYSGTMVFSRSLV
jgi:ABC-type anion transport system duplicated permease subunit